MPNYRRFYKKFKIVNKVTIAQVNLTNLKFFSNEKSA